MNRESSTKPRLSLRARVALIGFGVLVTVAAAPAQILSMNGSSLTIYLPSTTPVQGVRPVAQQRGVMFDGSRREAMAQPLAFSANPQSEGWNGNRRLDDLDLAVGTYSPTQIDMALPSTGLRWVVGRSYNSMQVSGGSHLDSNGYQGRNWFQMSQPSIVLYSDVDPLVKDEEDVLYLVYGADRYLEFKRSSTSDTFVGKNGATGVFVMTAGTPDVYAYTDEHGNVASFFGFDTSGNTTNGQFWKMTDPAGNVAFVGDATTASTAITNGYSGGKITTAYDSTDRRYTYTYSTIDSVSRLAQVKAETKTGGTWASPTGVAEVGKVDYAYYQTGDNTEGDNGNLKLVTVTTPLSPTSTSSVANTHYRYYKGTYNSSTNPGHPYGIKLVVGPEGCRSYDWSVDSSLDDDFLTASTSTLQSYAAAYLQYSSGRQVNSAFFNGQCGCSGGANGTYLFTYLDSSTASSNRSDTSYQNDWTTRTVIDRPDATWETQYFDEVGQPLSRVVTEGDPAGSPTGTWATQVTRSANAASEGPGLISEIRTPANITAYTHGTGTGGTFTASSSVGLIEVFTRSTAADYTKGFITEWRVKQGTSGSSILESAVDFDATPPTRSVGGFTLTRPVIEARELYKSETGTKGTSGTFDESTISVTAGTSGTALVILEVAATPPTVDTSTNGSGSTSPGAKQRYRDDSTPSFAKAADDIITYREFTNGQVTKSIQDADTAQTGAGQDFNGITIPSGFASSGTELHLKTTYTYDAQGRLDTTTLPSGRIMKMYYTKLSDGRLATLSIPSYVSGTTTSTGPVSYTVTNLAGGMEAQATIALTGGSSTTALSSWISTASADPIGAVSSGVGSLFGLRTQIYIQGGTKVSDSRTYFLNTSSPGYGAGTEGTNYDAARYGYDDIGRNRRVKGADGTITRNVFDALGRTSERWIGTNDSSFTGGEASGTDNMTKVATTEYDSGSSGGNSLVTTMTVDPDGNWNNTGTGGNPPDDRRITTFAYDYRGRMILQTNPQAPHVLNKHDNRGRIVATGLYTSTGSITVGTTDPAGSAANDKANRVGLSQSLFDEQGRSYRTQRHKITQSDGTDADNIATDTWFDAAGRPIKVRGEQLSKTQYDRLGRATIQYALASTDDSVYADADDVTGDVVLEQHQTAYEASTGNVLLRSSISRHHTDYSTGSTTGNLDSNADTDPLLITAANIKGRIQITAMWYDSLDRLTDTVAYGTNGIVGDGTTATGTFDRDPLSLPSRGPTALITSYVYNADGTVQSVTDPLNIENRTTYDVAGRETVEIRNYDNGTPSSSTGDDDLHTRFAYTTGHMTKMWVDVDGDGTEDAGDQVTTYTYGVTKGTSAGDSKLASNSLLYKTVYPEQTGSQAEADRRHLFAYNTQSQPIWMKDQTGNIVETDYDTGGRESHRRVTTLGTNLDNAVLRVSMTYLSRGLPSLVTQYDNATAGSGTIVDEVKYSYDDWGNVSNFEIDRDTAVGSGTANDYEVEYVFAKAGSSSTRQTVRTTKKKLKYASTQLNEVVYDYSSTGNLLDDSASRVTSVLLGATTVAEYRYLGLGHLVDTDLAQPDVFSRVHNGAAVGTFPTYPDWDSFNRITTNTWKKDLSTDRAFYDTRITYDEGSNIKRVQDMIQDLTYGGTRTFDALYSLDNLNRLLQAQEGNWNGTSISTQSRDEQWKDGSGNPALSQTGNWTRRRLNLNGNGDTDFTDTDELDDTGVFSDANELKTRDADSNASVNYTLAYNLRGDQTDDGKEYTYKYDAFGRLKEVRNRSTSALVSEYRYNGLGFRIGWHYDADADSDVDVNDPWYYFAHDDRWRIVGTFRGSDTSPKEAFVYHAAGLGGLGGSSYIDAVILRDRDINSGWTSAGDGTLEERRYLLQNWRGDVSVVTRDTNTSTQALVLEWIKYSSYGVPYCIPWQDTNLDGTHGSNDLTAFNTRYFAVTGGGPYDVRADTNLDGTVNSNDSTGNTNEWNAGVAGGRGKLSRIDVAVRHGYAGYQWDPNVKKYHVRHRAYDPDLGRWLRRDPLGYVDGMGLYEYVGDNPLGLYDAYGLAASVGGPPTITPVSPSHVTPGLGPIWWDMHPVKRPICSHPLVYCTYWGVCWFSCGAAISPYLSKPIDPTVNLPRLRRSPPKTKDERCEDAKKQKQAACGDASGTIPSPPLGWPEEQQGAPGSEQRQRWCELINRRIENNMACLAAREAVTAACYGGQGDLFHHKEEEIIRKRLERQRRVRDRLCPKDSL